MLEIEMEWEGKVYRYAPEAIGTAEAGVIKERTGMGLKTMSREVDDMNPVAIQALFYAIKCQNIENGHAPIYTSVDVGYPVKFMNKFNSLLGTAIAEDVKKTRAEAEAASHSMPTPTSATSEQ